MRKKKISTRSRSRTSPKLRLIKTSGTGSASEKIRTRFGRLFSGLSSGENSNSHLFSGLPVVDKVCFYAVLGVLGAAVLVWFFVSLVTSGPR